MKLGGKILGVRKFSLCGKFGAALFLNDSFRDLYILLPLHFNTWRAFSDYHLNSVLTCSGQQPLSGRGLASLSGCPPPACGPLLLLPAVPRRLLQRQSVWESEWDRESSFVPSKMCWIIKDNLCLFFSYDVNLFSLQVISMLPRCHQNVFNYLSAFLRELLRNSANNRLDVSILGKKTKQVAHLWIMLRDLVNMLNKRREEKVRNQARKSLNENHVLLFSSVYDSGIVFSHFFHYSEQFFSVKKKVCSHNLPCLNRE